MDFRTLDVTVLSANDLKHSKLFSKMCVYVAVSIVDLAIDSLSLRALKQQTPVDKTGDKSPTWNHPINLTINDVAAAQNRLSIRFQIYDKRVFPGDKLVGEIHVSVSELLSGQGDRKQASTLSYQVRSRSGKPKGVLNFSCKFGEKFTAGTGGAGGGFARVDPTTSFSYSLPPTYQRPVSCKFTYDPGFDS